MLEIMNKENSMCKERFEREHNCIIDNNKRNTKESLIVYDEEWNTLDDLCKLLNQQSQRIAELEDKWNKLREWARNSTEVLLYSIDDKPAKLGNKKYNYFERKQLLDKMQELENGEKK